MSIHIFPNKSTPFDFPIAVFLATAILGLLIAYDRFTALPKFAMLAISGWLFYTITSQPRMALAKFPKWLSWLGALLALYFLFTRNWHNMPVDFPVLQKIARIWTVLVPSLPLPEIHPNQVGGLLAVLTPFTALYITQVRQERQSSLSSKRYYGYQLAWLVGLLITFGLIMTSSRGAWLSLLVAVSLCLSWLILHYILRRFGFAALFSVLFLCLIPIILATVWIINNPDTFLRKLDRFENIPSGESRLDLYRETLALVSDFPYTGSGLNTFVGIYSRYIRSIPVVYFHYSHNLYLDLLLEQGPLALLSFLIIYLSAAFLLFKDSIPNRDSVELYVSNLHKSGIKSSPKLVEVDVILPLASLTSLLTLLFHGLIDDPLYGFPGALFLLLLPALALASTRSQSLSSIRSTPTQEKKNLTLFSWHEEFRLLVGSALLIILTVFLIPSWRESLIANFYVNIGDISLARYELIGFPTGQWDVRDDALVINRVQPWFDRALRYIPDNPAAHYHLGLIAARMYDFPTAIRHFEKAYQEGLDHEGVRKNLAYSYVWSGEIAKAMPLLVQIPEAKEEMEAYINWWRDLAHQNLSERAQRAVRALENYPQSSE